MPNQKAIPQAQGDFLLGNLRQFKADLFQAICGWQRDYGDLVSIKLATRQVYLISHPQLLEQALIKQHDVFVKMYNPEKPKGLALILGQGLVTSQGDLWRRQRHLMQPAFQRSNLASMLPQMVMAGNNMLSRWQQLGENVEVDLANEMMRLALEVITQTMFSTSVLDKVEKIAPALETALRYAAKTAANPLAPPLIIPTPANQQFKQARKLLDEIIYDLIEQRRMQPHTQHDLLATLLNAHNEDSGERMTDQQIRDEVITIFTAGHETTANLLSWTLYLLAKHPEILSKLRAELTQSLQGKIPDTEDLQSLVYMPAILNESLRIRPPVGMMIRKVNKDTELDGYLLKGGSLAIFSIYNIHHHPELWQHPEQFNPDRFLTDDKHRFSFIPFGTGERVCIGNHFALMEAQLLLSMIVQQYDIQLLNKEEVEIEMTVSIRPKGGIPVRLIKR
ncbi:MAG: cytochrome P450 [Methylococcaceae bacterium]|nr:cytochrome P450 [Methylococcaceae bacterium]